MGKSRDPVARRVALALEASGLSQSALAEALGTAQSTVQNWVAQGKPPGGAHLAKIPGLLNVSGHWLLTGKGPMGAPGATPDLERAREQGYRAGVAAAVAHLNALHDEEPFLPAAQVRGPAELARANEAILRADAEAKAARAPKRPGQRGQGDRSA